MGFNEFMTKLFGNKSQRDLKEITPYVCLLYTSDAADEL